MHWFKTFVAILVGLVATLVAVVGCLLLGLAAFMSWLVTCTGVFYESGCDRSDNGLLWIGFFATAFVVVAGAGTTLALLFRWLGHWIEPDREHKPMMPLVKVTAVFGGAAFVLFGTGTTIVAANREP